MMLYMSAVQKYRTKESVFEKVNAGTIEREDGQVNRKRYRMYPKRSYT